jgi:hypothetical protein
MSQAGFRNGRMAGKMEVNHSVIDHIMQGLQSTEMVDKLQQSGRPHKTTSKKVRLMSQCARRKDFAKYLLIFKIN